MRYVSGVVDGADIARREWLAEHPAHRAAAIGILCAAIGLRLAHINQPMRYDEAWMYLTYASKTMMTVVSDYSLPNNHIFHTLLVWLVTHVLGDAPWVIRLPTFVAGVALVPATYLATRRLAAPGAALFAAALTAALPVLVLYSTNARGYVIIALATVVLILLAGSLIADNRVEHWSLFALVLALGAYTAPVMAYPAGGVTAWILVERVRLGGVRGTAVVVPRMIAAVIVAATLTVVAYSPVIARSGTAPLLANRFVAPLPWDRFVGGIPDATYSAREVLGLGIAHWPGLLLALTGLASFMVAGPERMRRTTLAVTTACWCVLVLFATRHAPPARVWLFTVPLFCIYAGVGLDAAVRVLARGVAVRERIAASVASVTLAGLIAAHTVANGVVMRSEETDYSGLREAREIARRLLPRLQPGDRIVAFGTTGLPLDFYLRQLGGRRIADFDSTAPRGRVYVVANTRHGQTLDAVRNRRREVVWDDMVSPVVLWTIDGATVYETHARASGS